MSANDLAASLIFVFVIGAAFGGGIASLVIELRGERKPTYPPSSRSLPPR